MNTAEEFRYLILAAQREGARRLGEALAPLGVTSAQCEVLRVLDDFEPLSLIEVGRRLVCETGSPSRLVARLVEEGLVNQAPSPKDQRKVTLTLTRKGRTTLSKIAAIEDSLHSDLERLLAEAPTGAMMDLLWKFIDGQPSASALMLRKTPRTKPGDRA